MVWERAVSTSKRTDVWEASTQGRSLDLPFQQGSAVDHFADVSTLEQLEARLVDPQWLAEWVDFLRAAYSENAPPEHRALLPDEILKRREFARTPRPFDEAPQRLLSPIELISGAGAGLAALFAEGRLSRSTFLDILLHPAAVVDLHIALYASESLYWIGRVKKALRLAALRADESRADESRAADEDRAKDRSGAQ